MILKNGKRGSNTLEEGTIGKCQQVSSSSDDLNELHNEIGVEFLC
jgi:hypothetical protein